ncbi:hypothetical protein RB653_009500 [Dictyostelium firmibasis]|uniref:Uncharacterized protein n=1 Tax=Dictyostelium firmibasis TaxID=79012 RepID=A0AAN7UEE9_9MYCE
MENRKKILKIITLGDYNVGKTSMINSFLGNKTHSYCYPQFFFVKELNIENECVILQIWDNVSQERFDCLGTSYYRGYDCCVLCFDVNKEESFKNLDKWINEIRINCGENEKAPIILVGTKNDIEKTGKSISKERIEKWCKDNEDKLNLDKIFYFETSTKISNNITESFNAAAKLAYDHYIINNIKISTSEIKTIELQDQTEKPICCY